MKITVLGLRGIPNVQGGVETHAEQLYPRLAALGCSVEVIVRTPYVEAGRDAMGAVRLRRLWSPRRAGLEALVHSVIGTLYAGLTRPDILHVHAVGPAIVTPLARLLGLKVVVTHHGPDYDREKWGRFARAVLRSGECVGMRYSNARIAISRVIADLVWERHRRACDLIPNGVTLGAPCPASGFLDRLGVVPGRYFLQVSRIVPEKRQLDLIRAFAAARHPGWRLVLAGALGSDDYSNAVRAAAAESDTVLAGFVTGQDLRELYSQAGVFVLPSSHEGLPIALLEALSYGLPVVASDIPANLEVGLEPGNYFRIGDTAALATALARLAAAPPDAAARAAVRSWVAEKYDWDRIAAATLQVYQRVAGRPATDLAVP